jgi:hypothetical protein
VQWRQLSSGRSRGNATGRSLATRQDLGPCCFIRETSIARRTRGGQDWTDISMVSITEGGNEGSARPAPALALAR